MTAAASLVLSGMFSSCLKDKGFEDQKYGIDIQQIKAVAFPLSASSPVIGSITSQAEPQEYLLPNITLEHEGTAAADVTVTVTLNNALVDAANAADPTLGLEVLPASAYTIASTSVVIPKGSKFSVVLKLALPNSAALDPNFTYALGFTITAVSDGYTIAANQKDVVVGFAIMNIYDGVYSVESGTVTRYSAPGVPLNDALSGPLAGNPDIHLVTSGATTVTIPTTGVGSISWSGGGGVGGVDGISLTVDPVTNQVTSRSALNATFANWVGRENRYDPATKTFYLAWLWNPTGAVREYEVVLKYKEPR